VEESCGHMGGLSRYLPGGSERNNLSGYPLTGFETGTFQIQSGSADHWTAVFIDVNCRKFKF
jgi:hypothetical protein